MKKAWLHILLLGLLFNNTSLGQMLKLPVLVVHFLEHKESNKQITFFEYIAMHYGGDDLNDGDDERDRELPYKSFNGKSIHQVASIVPKTSFHTLPTRYVVTIAPPIKGDEHLPDRSLESLFRPPRV